MKKVLNTESYTDNLVKNMKNTNLTIEEDYYKLSIRDVKYVILFYIFGLGSPYMLLFKLNLYKPDIYGFLIFINLWIIIPIGVIVLLLNIYLRSK